MVPTPDRGSGSPDTALLELFSAIASHDHLETSRLLNSSPDLAIRTVQIGASRQDPDTYFLESIRHYAYRGDTPLHIAAAASCQEPIESLIASGADVRARNRRGAEPLHYAADGSPSAGHWDPIAQCEVIAILVDAGADPNAFDKSGVAPLHRAVRTRCSAAVSVLIENGADWRLRNKSGSTPLHLAVQSTGRSDSGSEAAKEQQRHIIDLLLRCGASPADVDANGKTVAAAASSDWIRHLLAST